MSAFEELKQEVKNEINPGNESTWLSAQDFASIAQFSLEEVYELLDAIDKNDRAALLDELADFCYHLLIYAELADKHYGVDLDAIAARALQKQKARRSSTLSDPDSAHAYWKRQKLKEALASKKSVLASIPKAMPALLRAQKLQDQAAAVGFDWDDVNEVKKKVREEWHELWQAQQAQDADAILDEMGDVFFSCVNLSRHLNISAEKALAQANEKFQRRFMLLEKNAHLNGVDLSRLSIDELEAMWQDVKASEKRG